MTSKSRFWEMLTNRQERGAGRGKVRRRHIGLFASLLVLASGLILVSGLSLSLSCGGVEGDRAKYGCPSDEVCSPETPGGLDFYGMSFSDGWHYPYDEPNRLPVTAVDGIQTFRVQTVDFFADLGEFTAQCSEDSFKAIQVNPAEMTVSVLALEEGISKLRILERGSEALFDRVDIRSAGIGKLELAPYVGDVDEETPPDEWPLLYGGVATRWIARLWDGDERLVDERTSIVSGDATSIKSVTPYDWDSAQVKPAEGVTAVTVKVSVGSMLQAFARADVTFEVDEIRVNGLPSTIELGAWELVCFRAYLQGRRVANAISNITITKPDQTQEEMWYTKDKPSFFGFSCGMLVADQLGVHTIKVQAVDIQEEYDYTVVPVSTPLLPMAAPSGPEPQFSRAERAGAWRRAEMEFFGPFFGTPGERARTRDENPEQSFGKRVRGGRRESK